MHGWDMDMIERQVRQSYALEVIICEPRYYEFEKRIANDELIKRHGEDMAKKLIDAYHDRERSWKALCAAYWKALCAAH